METSCANFNALSEFGHAGDHLVGWANSSVRHPDELPDLGDLTQARGIVREDPPEAALWSSSNTHRSFESTEVNFLHPYLTY